MATGAATWAIITGEYPPQSGGVSDYTCTVANALAAEGFAVHVWAPPAHPARLGEDAVRVERLPGLFDVRSLLTLRRALARLPAGTPVLIQYVPHGFGWKAMNVPFALWVWWHGRRHRIWTMFHEVAVAYGTGRRWRDHAMAFVTRRMASLVARGSSHIFISIPAWEKTLRGITTIRAPMTWLPIPSNLRDLPRPAEVAALRARFMNAEHTLAVGHFGTYGAHVKPLLEPLITGLCALLPSARLILLGRGSEEFCECLTRQHPSLRGQLHCAGPLPAQSLAEHLAACDLLLQPYPDGISTRRTSAMAGLALGVPTVSNSGHLTEALWAETGCVALAGDASPAAMLPLLHALVIDPAKRAQLGQLGQDVYRRRFSFEKLLAVLLEQYHKD